MYCLYSHVIVLGFLCLYTMYEMGGYWIPMDFFGVIHGAVLSAAFVSKGTVRQPPKFNIAPEKGPV